MALTICPMNPSCVGTRISWVEISLRSLTVYGGESNAMLSRQGGQISIIGIGSIGSNHLRVLSEMKDIKIGETEYDKPEVITGYQYIVMRERGTNA